MGTERGPSYPNANAGQRAEAVRDGQLGSGREPLSSRVPRDFERWPQTEGYPPISGGSGIKRYYEEYIAEKHPDWSRSAIRREVQAAMGHDNSRLWKEMEAMFEEVQKDEAFRLFDAFEEIRGVQSSNGTRSRR